MAYMANVIASSENNCFRICQLMTTKTIHKEKAVVTGTIIN